MAFERVDFESENGTIDLLISEPSQSTDVTVLFGGGWSSRHIDYEHFLESFADDARVIAINPPNHERSSGDFTQENYADFIRQVTRQYGSKDVIPIGHSSGATALADVGFSHVVLLNPYLEKNYLASGPKSFIGVCDVLEHIPGLSTIAKMAYMNPRHNFHMKDPIRSSAELNRFEIKPSSSRAILFSSDDELNTVGTEFERVKYQRELVDKFESLIDESHQVSGLNHCFNESGYAPFCNDRKVADRIKESIYHHLL